MTQERIDEIVKANVGRLMLSVSENDDKVEGLTIGTKDEPFVLSVPEDAIREDMVTNALSPVLKTLVMAAKEKSDRSFFVKIEIGS